MKTVTVLQKAIKRLISFLWILSIFFVVIACTEDHLPFPEKDSDPKSKTFIGELEVEIESEDSQNAFVLDIKGIGEQKVSAKSLQSYFLKNGTYELEVKGFGQDYEVEGKNPLKVDIISKNKIKILIKILKKLHCHTNEQIIFSSNRTGFYEVFAMNTDGSHVRKLTDFNSSTHYPLIPEVSGDGEKVVFTLAGDIHTMNIDGTNIQQLTVNPGAFDRDFAPSWSKDGSQIVFSRMFDGDESIHIMNADGSNIMQISDIGADGVIMPNMSPDGSKVVFVRDLGLSPEGAKIYMVNSDGTNEHMLIDHSFLNFDPKWSPDGSKILFKGSPGGGGASQIFVANADGTGVVQISFDAPSKLNVNWSPDGDKIVYTSYVSSEITNIYTMSADGSNVVQITDNLIRDHYPSWGPVPSSISLP